MLYLIALFLQINLSKPATTDRMDCSDTIGWKDLNDNACYYYGLRKLCSNSLLSSIANGGIHDNFPENNCCGCGKSMSNNFYVA